MDRRATLRLLTLASLAGGCDYNGDILFPDAIPGVPAVWVLTDPDGGNLVPADVTTIDELRAATIYSEVGAPSVGAYSGVTFDFLGTGGDICIWVDSETAGWSQAVSPQPGSDFATKWSYPDNIYDDADIDLFAGFSVYYTGSPGESIGDFVVNYEDSLGNDVPISLANCPNDPSIRTDPAQGGRGAPDFCTLTATDANISYTALLRVFATPLDDDRAGFGLVIANGTCDALKGVVGGGSIESDECVIEGESLTPVQLKEDQVTPVYYGFDDLNADGRIWPGSIDFEDTFCDDSQPMKPFCRDEANALADDGKACQWETIENPDDRCYCGDTTKVPGIGAF